MKYIQNRIFYTGIFIALIAMSVILHSYIKERTEVSLRINEVSFTRNGGVDWIEIYNPTLNARSLKDMYLSDSRKKYRRYKFGEVIVPAGGYVVLYGDGVDAPQGATMVNFRVANGETLYLVGQSGTDVLDSLTAVLSATMPLNATIGRLPDGSEHLGVLTPTPGMANTAASGMQQ